MKFLIVTGISGAGKTQVLHFLEDMGYYCIDNMPVLFLSAFAQAVSEGKIKAKNVAVVTDIRGGEMFSNIEEELSKISKDTCPYEIVFLEADHTALVRRYKETRRAHPLAPHGPVEKGINAEKEIMASIRKRADHVINTSNLLTRELHEIVREKFGDGAKKKEFFSVNIMSFGFKYGIPIATDLVMDVRFLPNPYYVEDMRYRTGLDEDVYKYVTDNKQCADFVREGNRVESTVLGTDGTYTINYLNPGSVISSTTGNYSGVYDLSGGSYGYVMGYTTEITTLYPDFFNDPTYTKYWDKYTSLAYTNYNNRILGDATGEMGPFFMWTDPDGADRQKSSWYNDYSYFAISTMPWFTRGGSMIDGDASGVFSLGK